MFQLVDSRLLELWYKIFEDPAIDLKYVVPLRLYGDGAEAQRILTCKPTENQKSSLICLK